MREDGLCNYCEDEYESKTPTSDLDRMRLSIYTKYDVGICYNIPTVATDFSNDFENKSERLNC